MKQKTILIYHNYICQIGGVETFLYNFCLNLRNYYDITVLYCSGDRYQVERLSKIVKLDIYDKKKHYTCDIFIRNSVWGEVPNNITSLDNRYLEMRHANYKYLYETGRLHMQYHVYDNTNEVIGCGEYVSKMSDEILHDSPTTIKNILAPKAKTNRILKLISCTRIDEEKGWKRMLKLMEMLKREGIKFEWNIFTNSRQMCNYEEVHFYKQRFDIWDYLADSDYTVLLSDSEGLPYTIQESLQYKTPCIVTDVGGCTELIQEGVNGYIVPLNMKFDVRKILKIPKCKEYDNHALEDWLNYLGNAVYIEKEEERSMRYLVEATDEFELKNLIDGDRGIIPKKGEQWEVSESRMKILSGANSLGVKFVEVIREIPDEIETAAKEVKAEKAIKKTTKKSK